MKKTKRAKLFPCDYCRRPMMMLKPHPKMEDGTRKKGWIWVAGPTTHPKVKRWCDGSCDGLVLRCGLVLEDDAKYYFKGHKNLKRFLLHLKKFRFELVEYLKARDKDRVPRSEEAAEIRNKLRRKPICRSSKSR